MSVLSEKAAETRVAAMLKALGEPRRLRIFRFLCSCCCPVIVDEETGDVRPVSGPTVGEVCCHITGHERVTSTISEHMRRDEGMRRRYLAELVGTFGIVFAPVALSASGHLAGGDGSLSAAAWASGLSVLAMIYALGHISAAHFNPAVTLGFAVAGRFPWRFVPGYWAAQCLGAFLAAALTSALFCGAGYGIHIPAASLYPLRAVGLEASLTFLLMLVIISVATDRRVSGAVPGLAIGLAVVFLVWIGGPATGGSMNPARSLGPALMSGGRALSVWWVYALGPCLGAVLAARLYEALRGGSEHAQGAPNDLAIALRQVERTQVLRARNSTEM